MAQMDYLPGKVAFVGDSGVGKTSIINKFVKKPGEVEPTVGGTAVPCTYTINGSEVKLNVWDTAGQEEYQSLLPMYVGMSHVVVIVYDVTRPATWDSVVESWYEKLDGKVPHICVVGNKMDCESAVNEEVVITFCEEKGAEMRTTSAMNGNGIDNLFEWIATKVDKDINSAPGVVVTDPLPESNAQGNGGCCNVC